MPKQPPRILAVNPGTRYLGIAFLDGPELKDWGVKVIKGRWSKEKLKKATAVVSDVIVRYQPNTLAMKRLHPSRSSPNLNLLVGRLRELGRRKRLKVCRYSIKELEQFFSPGQRRNKRELAETISSRYPALLQELTRERAHRNPYHIRMFEAVALASACFNHLDKP